MDRHRVPRGDVRRRHGRLRRAGIPPTLGSAQPSPRSWWKEWPEGGIEQAIRIIRGLGGNPGQDCRYIQCAAGMLYFYLAGDESGESGDETWRLDPIE